MWHSAIGSKVILLGNANDCIHHKSFVGYSLCSLSFFSKTAVLLWQAQRCVNSSLSHHKKASLSESTGCSWNDLPSHRIWSPLPYLLCNAWVFVLKMLSVFYHSIGCTEPISIKKSNSKWCKFWKLFRPYHSRSELCLRKDNARIFKDFCFVLQQPIMAIPIKLLNYYSMTSL